MLKHNVMMKVVCRIGSFPTPHLILSRPSAVHVGATPKLLAGVNLKSRLSYGRGGGPLAKVSSHCTPPVVSPAWSKDQPNTHQSSWLFTPV